MRAMRSMRKKLAALVTAVAVSAPVPALAYHVDPSYARERTALAVVHPDGRISMSPEGEEPRAALSLSKLFLGYWVLYHGTADEKKQVEKMIAKSDDGIASRLDAKYPQAIDEIANDFDLKVTARAGYWGKTQTSARDLATFIAGILWDPVAKPLLRGMEKQSAVASDGFIQGFGTARLTDVKGSKMGWADERTTATGSVSYGQVGDDTFAVAALTAGSAYQNTIDTRLGIKTVDDSPKSKR